MYVHIQRHNTSSSSLRTCPQELWTTDRIWVRYCGHCRPSHRSTTTPNAVLQRSLRHCQPQIGEKTDKVSTSRLKPCSTHQKQPCPATATYNYATSHSTSGTATPTPGEAQKGQGFDLTVSHINQRYFHLEPLPLTKPARLFERPEKATTLKRYCDEKFKG
jgi:hypothetical protein